MIAFVLNVGLDFAIAALRDALNIPTDEALDAIARSRTGLPVVAALPTLGLSTLEVMARALISAPVAVAIHRFILLGETRPYQFLSGLTLRFAAWIFFIDFLSSLISWAMDIRHAMSVGFRIMTLIVAIKICVLTIRLILLYPAVAVREKDKSDSGPFETALLRSRGTFWLTIGSLALTILPAFALAMLGSFVLAFVSPVLAFTSTSTLMGVWYNLFGVLAIALAAAVASYLYSYAAHRDAAAA